MKGIQGNLMGCPYRRGYMSGIVSNGLFNESKCPAENAVTVGTVKKVYKPIIDMTVTEEGSVYFVGGRVPRDSRRC